MSEGEHESGTCNDLGRPAGGAGHAFAGLGPTPPPPGARTTAPRPTCACSASASRPTASCKFCERDPDECRQGAPEEQRFSARPDRLSELDAVNRAVNREIEAATDLEIYGQTEYWTIPTTRGDCEDYALLKRKRLIARGWPISSLLLTVVRDEKGEGHAVLTARTVQGDFILDNKVDEVKVWNRTRYEYVMRQSYLNTAHLDVARPARGQLQPAARRRAQQSAPAEPDAYSCRFSLAA